MPQPAHLQLSGRRAAAGHVEGAPAAAPVRLPGARAGHALPFLEALPVQPTESAVQASAALPLPSSPQVVFRVKPHTKVSTPPWQARTCSLGIVAGAACS